MRISSPRFTLGNGVLVYESIGHGTTVSGKQVEVPRQLIAISLETGEQLWIRQLRETEYRGPYPP